MQDRAQNNLLLINPTLNPLNDETKPIILSLLKTAKTPLVLMKGKTFRFRQYKNRKEYELRVTFTHTLLLRKREATDAYVIDIVSNDKSIGSGASGLIQRIDCTIRQSDDKPDTLIIKNAHRVTKQQWSSVNIASLTDVSDEYEVSKKVGYLHIKSALFYRNQSFLIMREKSGKHLSTYYHGNTFGIPLEPFTRLKLTRELCYSYIEQIVTHDIIHRDIKPENILVNIDSNGIITTHFIDFGLGRLAAAKEEPDHYHLGTKLYLAPERILRSQSSPESDWYSLVTCLCELWSGDIEDVKLTLNLFNENPKAFIELRTRIICANFTKNMHNTSTSIKNPLYLLFHKILKAEPAKRPTPHYTLRCINDLLLSEYKRLETGDHASIDIGYQVALSFNALISKLRSEDRTLDKLDEIEAVITNYFNLIKKANDSTCAFNSFTVFCRFTLPGNVKTIESAKKYFITILHERSKLIDTIAERRNHLIQLINNHLFTTYQQSQLAYQLQCISDRIDKKLKTHRSDLINFTAVNKSLNKRVEEWDAIMAKIQSTLPCANKSSLTI